jgi:hypothetical protein
MRPITVQDVEKAQQLWGSGIVEIGAGQTWEEAHSRACSLLQALYRCDGSLLFCPTKARIIQFRRTVSDSASYFVGRDPSHPEDQGFALEPWREVRFDNIDIVINTECALAMGNYTFLRADGTELIAEYSLVYARDQGGKLRIQLHHSALPYSPK